tara:strand:- start:167 stop:406 length:240 start_codon:yes stop_codon:yes gene_type:complete
MATIIDRMKLENMLGKINTHNANVVHGWILFQDAVSALRTLDEVLLHLGTEGRVHPISHTVITYSSDNTGLQQNKTFAQ